VVFQPVADVLLGEADTTDYTENPTDSGFGGKHNLFYQEYTALSSGTAKQISMPLSAFYSASKIKFVLADSSGNHLAVTEEVLSSVGDNQIITANLLNEVELVGGTTYRLGFVCDSGGSGYIRPMYKTGGTSFLVVFGSSVADYDTPQLLTSGTSYATSRTAALQVIGEAKKVRSHAPQYFPDTEITDLWDGSSFYNEFDITVAPDTNCLVIRVSGTINQYGVVTLGGAEFTLLDRQNDGNASQVEVWYLMNPPTGTNTFKLVASGSGFTRNYLFNELVGVDTNIAPSSDGMGTWTGTRTSTVNGGDGAFVLSGTTFKAAATTSTYDQTSGTVDLENVVASTTPYYWSAYSQSQVGSDDVTISITQDQPSAGRLLTAVFSYDHGSGLTRNSTTYETDTSNSLTNGLVFASYFENSNTLPVLGTEAKDNSVGAGVDGWEQDGDTVLEYDRPAGLNPQTGTIIVAHTGFTDQASPATFAKFAVLNDAEFQLMRGGNDTAIRVAVGGVNAVALTNFDDFEDDRDHTISGTWDKSINTMTAGVDGYFRSEITNAWSSAAFTFPTLNFLNRASGLNTGANSRATEGRIRYAFLWDRVLTEAEIESIRFNPYQLVKPKEGVKYLAEYSGASWEAPTLGDLHTTGSKLRIEVDNVTWASGSGYLFSQAASATVDRSLGLYINGTALQARQPNGSAWTVEDPIVSSLDNVSIALDMDWSLNTMACEIDGTRYTTSLVSLPFPYNYPLRFGARGDTDGADGSPAYLLGLGDSHGETRIYIDDVLVRKYVVPSSGSTMFDAIGENHATLIGSGMTFSEIVGGTGTYTDDFNRADESPLGGDWSTEIGSGLSIVSNQVRRVSGAAETISSLSSLTFSDAQSAQIELTAIVNYDFIGVGVRFNGSGSGYVARFNSANDRVELYRFDSGVRSDIGGVYSAPMVVGDTLRLEASGDTLKAFVNDLEVATTTDATYSGGSPAIYYNAENFNGTLGDNFIATGLISGGTGNTVENSFGSLWNIYQTTSNSLEARWSILQAVANSTRIDWALLQQVISNTGINWAIFNSVNGATSIRWDLVGAVTSGLRIDWNLLQAASSALSLDWNVLQQAQSGAELRFNVLQQAQNAVGIEFNIYSAVDRSFEISWDSLGSLNTINSSVRFDWSILNTVEAALQSEWSLLNSVGVSLELRHNISQQVAQAIETQYNILNSVSNSISLQWDSIEQINGVLSLSWSIQVDGYIAPVNTMVVLGENRVMTVLGESRVMKIN
jgi:hypothetical protein